MSTVEQTRDFRFVNQVDRGGRPEADHALEVAGDRLAAALPSHCGCCQPRGVVEPVLAEIRVSLENHIARIDQLRRRATAHDRQGRIAEALRLLQDLERDLAIAARGDLPQTVAAVHPTATDPITDTAGLGLPLVSLGQGTSRRDLHGDPETGRLLDLRA